MTRSPLQHDAPCTPKNAIARRSTTVLAALILTAAWCGPGYALDIVAIEEHWELQVGGPVVDSSAPQVCMVMAPQGHLDGDYFLFTLNHRSGFGYESGGMQVQLWCGEDVIDNRDGSQTDTLNQTDEVIRWVQRIEITGNTLSFEIHSGESASWGQFGGQGLLRLATTTNLTNLNGYAPAVSLTESGVSFGGNRVRSLMLTKIRWFDSLGNAYELNAPIDVDADLDP